MAPGEFDLFALKLRDDDDVAVVKRAIPAGAQLQMGVLTLHCPKAIAPGHKIAVREIEPGMPVRKVRPGNRLRNCPYPTRGTRPYSQLGHARL